MEGECPGGVEVGRETGSNDICSKFIADIGFSVVGVDGRWQISIEHERKWELVMTSFERMVVSFISLQE